MLRLHVVRVPLKLHCFILCTWRSGGTAHEGGGSDQSIGSTVSDAIFLSWLWLTETRISPLGCTGMLLAIEDLLLFQEKYTMTFSLQHGRVIV